MPAEDRDREFVLLARLVRTQGRHGELIARELVALTPAGAASQAR
jgi:hypothetical protein